MAKKKSNKNKKVVRNRIFVFFVLFGGVIGSLSYSFFSNVSKILQMKEEKKSLEHKLVELQEREGVLASDVKKLEDPEYVARYAREKYLYSKEGELIIRIPEDD